MANGDTTNGEVIEFILSGEKLLSENANNLDLVAKAGDNLYRKNRDFIREKVKDNWFVIIEPISGTFLACSSQLKLFEYAQEKFPERLFHSIGLLKNNSLQYAR